jgi:hypothetical protein
MTTKPRYIARRDGRYWYIYDTQQQSWDTVPLVSRASAKHHADWLNYSARMVQS